jgi:hypothetical protein
MNYVKLIYSNGTYSYKGASSIEMDIIGFFLASNVGCYWPSFRQFALNNHEKNTSGNTIYLEKENGNVLLSDLYSQEKQPTQVKMSNQQYIALLDDWQEKVCKLKPKEVIITYDNDQFSIEIND